MLKIKILYITIFLTPLFFSSQNDRAKNIVLKPKSIALKFIGAPTHPLGVSYGQMINDRVSMELGIGLLSAGAGVEFYLTNPRKHRFNLNAGVFGSYNFDGFPMAYFPLGVSYLGKKNFQYNINVGALYSKDVTLVSKKIDFWPWFGLSIAKRFGEDVKTSKIENKAEELQINKPNINQNTTKTETIGISEKKTTPSNIIGARIGFLFPFIGFNYERLITPKIGIETSVGFPGVSLGANAYISGIKSKKMSFKIGIVHGISIILVNEMMTYFPVGINYLSKRNMILGFDGGLQFWYSASEILPGFSFKLGKAF